MCRRAFVRAAAFRTRVETVLRKARYDLIDAHLHAAAASWPSASSRPAAPGPVTTTRNPSSPSKSAARHSLTLQKPSETPSTAYPLYSSVTAHQHVYVGTSHHGGG